MGLLVRFRTLKDFDGFNVVVVYHLPFIVLRLVVLFTNMCLIILFLVS